MERRLKYTIYQTNSIYSTENIKCGASLTLRNTIVKYWIESAALVVVDRRPAQASSSSSITVDGNKNCN